jgi:hypothetical protein
VLYPDWSADATREHRRAGRDDDLGVGGLRGQVRRVDQLKGHSSFWATVDARLIVFTDGGGQRGTKGDIVRIKAVIAAAAVTMCGTAGAATAAHAAAAPVPVLFNCYHQPENKPDFYIIACTNVGSFIVSLSWTSWTATSATATGVQEVDNCTPDCTQGTFDPYPVSVTFSDPAAVAGHPGETHFSRIAVSFTTSARPSSFLSLGKLLQNPAQWIQTLGS